MHIFLIHRSLQALLIISVMSFVVFMLLGLMPGDPVDLLVSGDPNLTPEDAARIKALYGLDQPLPKRYATWLTSAIQGDLGYSRLFGLPVGTVITEALAKTLLLMVCAFILTIAIAIPVGMLAARKIQSKLDYTVNLLCFSGISIPPFWLALMFILLFSVVLGWFPASYIPIGESSISVTAKSLVLPILTLTLISVGGVTRYVRASLNESIRQDYVRTALAKGLSNAQAIRRHALRNSMITVVTILALDVGAFFSGALIIEIMFGYPGMGKLIFDAINGNDYNLALATLLLSTALVLIANFIADVMYAWLDPRVHFQAAT